MYVYVYVYIYSEDIFLSLYVSGYLFWHAGGRLSSAGPPLHLPSPS